MQLSCLRILEMIAFLCHSVESCAFGCYGGPTHLEKQHGIPIGQFWAIFGLV